MTDYKEAFSDLSDINVSLEKSLEHINIKDSIEILLKERLKDRLQEELLM
jgi:hypothetical protein